MNQTNSSTDLMIFLKKRIHCLEEANRAYMELIDILASSGDFQIDLYRGKSTEAIFQITLTQLERILPFMDMGLLESMEDASFALNSCKPQECREELLSDIDAAIMRGSFALALNQTHAFFVPAPSGKHTLLLHAISTRTHTSGMFVGRLPNSQTNIDASSIKALSIILFSTAHALENLVLYSMLHEYVHNLEKKIQGQTKELLTGWNRRQKKN
jgi:hypothetical protein